MDQSHPPTSAQHVALVGTPLHRAGVVDDPRAVGMLRAPWDQADRLFRRSPVARLERNPSLAGLDPRGVYLDEAVTVRPPGGSTPVLTAGRVAGP